MRRTRKRDVCHIPRLRGTEDWNFMPECTPLYGQTGCEDSPLQLPEAQEPHFPLAGPGKPENGRLWFDGGEKVRAASEGEEKDLAEKVYYKKRKPTDHLRLRPRDVRRGDRWLPWHKEPEK